MKTNDSSLLEVKPQRFSQSERSQFILTNNLKEVLIGVLLGDLYARRRHLNTNLTFKQGVVHKEYLEHLYELFKDYCLSEPKISKDNSIRFHTRSLQCFLLP